MNREQLHNAGWIAASVTEYNQMVRKAFDEIRIPLEQLEKLLYDAGYHVVFTINQRQPIHRTSDRKIINGKINLRFILYVSRHENSPSLAECEVKLVIGSIYFMCKVYGEKCKEEELEKNFYKETEAFQFILENVPMVRL